MIEYSMQIDEWLEKQKSKLEKDIEFIEALLEERRQARREKARKQGLIK